MKADRVIHMVPMLALAVVLAACPDSDPAEPEPEADPLTVTTVQLPVGVVGETYSAGVDAEGGSGDYTWSLESGSLPLGLALSVEDLPDNDVLITGIPEQPGSFSFVLRVASEDGQSRTRSFTIEVMDEPAPVGIATAVLPPALVGASYDTRLQATGGDGGYTWSLTGGTLPAGLTLTTDGRLHGTPSAADTVMLLIRVESAGLDAEKAFTLQVVANRNATFDLTVAPVVAVPTAIQPALDAAFDRWEGVITGDLPQAAIPVGFFAAGDCGGFGSILNGTSADDLIVLVNIRSIDGPFGTVAQAGPCVIRGSNLPFAGVLTLDADDLEGMTSARITEVMVHEIGHVLGFGSLWDLLDLVTSSTTDPRYTGAAAVAEWNALGGTGSVPVEAGGGEGTAGSHWRESVFDEELLTGFLEQPGVFQPLSRMSIASLDDLGYSVNRNAADGFSLAPPMSAAMAAADRSEAPGYDVVLRETIYRIDDDGTITILRGEP